MLTTAKQAKMLAALKIYSKQYLQGKYKELDESGTRLMINHFLTEVLGFIAIEEVKTEYMIRGTYADYMVQIKGKRHFLVEVKALSIELSESHLRQASNYAANEGVDWALLTNGKNFDLYRINFTKPITNCKVFSFDLSSLSALKDAIEHLQYIHKDSVVSKGLDMLWYKCRALDPVNMAAYLYTPLVINYIRRSLREKFDHRFSEEEIKESIDKVVVEKINLEDIKHIKIKKKAEAKPAIPIKTTPEVKA